MGWAVGTSFRSLVRRLHDIGCSEWFVVYLKVDDILERVVFMLTFALMFWRNCLKGKITEVYTVFKIHMKVINTNILWISLIWIIVNLLDLSCISWRPWSWILLFCSLFVSLLLILPVLYIILIFYSGGAA